MESTTNINDFIISILMYLVILMILRQKMNV